MEFEWDFQKELQNIKKHNIRFHDAIQIFKDPFTLSVYDDNHSTVNEDRWITIGGIPNGSILVVVHAYIEKSNSKEKIRIISARKADNFEKKRYYSLRDHV